MLLFLLYSCHLLSQHHIQSRYTTHVNASLQVEAERTTTSVYRQQMQPNPMPRRPWGRPTPIPWELLPTHPPKPATVVPNNGSVSSANDAKNNQSMNITASINVTDSTLSINDTSSPISTHHPTNAPMSPTPGMSYMQDPRPQQPGKPYRRKEFSIYPRLPRPRLNHRWDKWHCRRCRVVGHWGAGGRG